MKSSKKMPNYEELAQLSTENELMLRLQPIANEQPIVNDSPNVAAVLFGESTTNYAPIMPNSRRNYKH
jgi:hypothetical protein